MADKKKKLRDTTFIAMGLRHAKERAKRKKAKEEAAKKKARK